MCERQITISDLLQFNFDKEALKWYDESKVIAIEWTLVSSKISSVFADQKKQRERLEERRVTKKEKIKQCTKESRDNNGCYTGTPVCSVT